MPDRSWVPDSLNYGRIPKDCRCGSCEESPPPDCRYRDFLMGIVRRLQGTSIADRMRVFGSAATGKPRPGDVDVLIDFDPSVSGEALSDLRERRPLSADEAKALRQVLRLAEAAYGSLDPFYRLNGSLWVRNDSATGWIPARHARAIYRTARESGVPIGCIRGLPHPNLAEG